MTPANPCLASPFAKPDSGSRPKNSAYPLNRRPAGGLSRPLPSPGNLGLLIFSLELLVINEWLVMLQSCLIDVLFVCLKKNKLFFLIIFQEQPLLSPTTF